MGLVLLGASPGGMMANTLTHLAARLFALVVGGAIASEHDTVVESMADAAAATALNVAAMIVGFSISKLARPGDEPAQRGASLPPPRFLTEPENRFPGEEAVLTQRRPFCILTRQIV